MSSGNPFRRALKQDESPASNPRRSSPSGSSQLTAQQQPLAIQSSIRGSSPLGKTKKQVRIRSPDPTSPISPNYFSRTFPLPQAQAESNPPLPQDTSPASSEGTPTDPFGSSAVAADPLNEDEELIQNTKQNSGADESAPGSAGMPLNPFQKTLATMEPGSAPTPAQKEKIARIDGMIPAKSAMDVDSFTRMLLTGQSAQRKLSEIPQAQVKIHSYGPAVDSNSSTDTSSVSRQSIFDMVQGPQLESPRTSYEMSHSDDDEESSLMGEGRKSEKEKDKKKPPPPKPRHGKLVTARMPQTVSFADFNASAPAQQLPSPTLQRSPTDLNKPLPSLPESSSTEASEASSIASEKTPTMPAKEVAGLRIEHDLPPTPQKKVPPAVPLARRQSQLRTATQSRDRSNSGQTTGSQDDIHPSSGAESLSLSRTQSQKMPPPPPPPSRRHAASLSNSINNGRNTSTSSLGPTSPIEAPQSPASRPSGGSLAQALSSAQGQSNSSQSSLASPPPPPPRRRASSGRASLDMQRPSVELGRGSFDSARRSSVASSLTSPRKEHGARFGEGNLAEEPEELAKPGNAAMNAEAPQRDILADMEAFQKEIDALRKAHEN